MLPLSISRNRKVEREQKVHNIAVRRALERKAIRQFVKANPDVLTDEEELQDSVPEQESEQLKYILSQVFLKASFQLSSFRGNVYSHNVYAKQDSTIICL